MKAKTDISISLIELSEKLGGHLANLPSGEDILINNIATLESADSNSISFITTEKFLKKAATSSAAAFLAPHGMNVADRPTLCVESVWKSVQFLFDTFYPSIRPPAGVDATAILGKNVLLGKNVYIGPFCVVEDNVVIGDNTIVESQSSIGHEAMLGSNCYIHPHVVIMGDTLIGNNVIIHPGAVIGSDGYKYEQIDGKLTKIRQIGRVVIEDDVEIGANTCIDRATLSETRIGKGTKIDNLVHVAHNVTIGKNCLIIAQVGIAGSSSIGDNCILAGQVGIADNIKIGNNVLLGAQCGVHRNIPDNERCLGTPAIPAKQFARIAAAMQKLPEMSQHWNKLSSKVNELMKSQETGIE